jgi:hypothetical protein
VCREIRSSESINGARELASLAEVFELLQYGELEAAERRFTSPEPQA